MQIQAQIEASEKFTIINIVNGSFSLDEMKLLCDYSNIDFENIANTYNNKQIAAQNIVTYFIRRSTLNILLDAIVYYRPNLNNIVNEIRVRIGEREKEVPEKVFYTPIDTIYTQQVEDNPLAEIRKLATRILVMCDELENRK